MKKLSMLIAILVFVTGFCTLHANAQSQGCTNPLNRDPISKNGFTSLSVSETGTQEFAGQTYTVTGCMDADHVPAGGLPIVLAFHGGGECVYEGEREDCKGNFLNYSHLWELHALVVAPSGNKSFNGTNWSNAFPWMQKTDPLDNPVQPTNDLDLPDIIIADIKANLTGWIPLPINFNGYYAVGKSDGAGMAMELACSPQTQANVLGVGLVSGAYFGLGSATKFNNGDHSICLPGASIPVIIMHATDDKVMPYLGQNFLNETALNDARTPPTNKYAYWPVIDPEPPGSCCNNTYTADVPNYVQAIADTHGCNGNLRPENVSTAPAYPIELTRYNCPAAPVSFVIVPGGDHCWFGYEHSGPAACNSDPNVDYSATKGIADFFKIGWGQ